MEKNFPEKINVSPLLTELINQIPLTEKTSFKFSKINEYNNLCLKSKMWDDYSRKFDYIDKVGLRRVSKGNKSGYNRWEVRTNLFCKH